VNATTWPRFGSSSSDRQSLIPGPWSIDRRRKLESRSVAAAVGLETWPHRVNRSSSPPGPSWALWFVTDWWCSVAVDPHWWNVKKSVYRMGTEVPTGWQCCVATGVIALSDGNVGVPICENIWWIVRRLNLRRVVKKELSWLAGTVNSLRCVLAWVRSANCNHVMSAAEIWIVEILILTYWCGESLWVYNLPRPVKFNVK
jgi:hypothetical protein